MTQTKILRAKMKIRSREDLATVATLQEGQKEVVDHPQDEMGEVGDSRSEIGDDFIQRESTQGYND